MTVSHRVFVNFTFPALADQ